MSLTVDIKKKLKSFSLDVSLETNGGIMGILGASGSGKSVTLKCIAGIIKPDSGRISLDGKILFDSAKKINLPPQKRNVGYLFQDYALFPNMTVEQNILCGMRNNSWGKEETKEKLQAIIKLTDLEGLEFTLPHQLSGGQQQRTALARILVNEPNLLLLDEPFGAVDSYLRERLQTQMCKLLKNLNALFVSHNRDEIFSLCGKTAIVDGGKITGGKDTKQLWQNPETRICATLTGCKNIANAKKIGEYEVLVTDWGVSFKTARPVQNGLCAVGIRARLWDADIRENNFKVQITDKTERPFEYGFMFRFENQREGTKDVCCFIPKQRGGDCFERIGIRFDDVMLLYE